MKTTEITIKAGTSFELPLMLSKKGTVVHWVFHTKGYDIRFGIAKGRPGADREFLVANTSYAPDSPQQGKVTLPDEGDYFLVWDNSYSWIREKHVLYSVEIVLPELTVMEKVECAKTIMNDIEEKKSKIEECQKQENEQKEMLVTLGKEREEKCEELERIKKELMEVEEKVKECDGMITTLQSQASQEQTTIDMLTSLAPFLLEGNRVISMLTGPDLLRLSCVNRVLHNSIQRDSVWIRVFKQDSKEDIDVVLQNEWLEKKWSLLNPGVTSSEESKPEVV